MSPLENDPNGYPFDGGKDWREACPKCGSRDNWHVGHGFDIADKPPGYIIPEIDAGPDDLHWPSKDWPQPKPPPFDADDEDKVYESVQNPDGTWEEREIK